MDNITSRHDPRFEVTMYKYMGVENSHKLDFYEQHGGYQTAKKALTTMQSVDIVNEVKASGLRGRGGAGFPMGVKWSFMPPVDGRQRFIVCNADESEPGSTKDRFVLEDDPHQLIEGMIIAGYAIQATLGVIYIRGEYHLGYTRLYDAINEARAKGYLGKNVLASNFDFDLILHRGAGAYICGEESALMNSFEGYRANPRLKPPFPAQAGVYGFPTSVNNVTSIASGVHIIAKGADWFKSMGTQDSSGFHHVQISGPAVRRGVYEVPMGITYREIIFDLAGGVTEPVKAFIPGGSSCPMFPFTDEYLDLTMEYGVVAKAGSMMGTGGIILIPEDKCIVDALANVVHFYAHESCGKCTPCREGVSTWLPKMYAKLLAGLGESGDLELLEDVSHNIRGRSFCPLADACIMPVQASIKHFRHEYEYIIEHGKSMYAKKSRWQE